MPLIPLENISQIMGSMSRILHLFNLNKKHVDQRNLRGAKRRTPLPHVDMDENASHHSDIIVADVTYQRPESEPEVDTVGIYAGYL